MEHALADEGPLTRPELAERLAQESGRKARPSTTCSCWRRSGQSPSSGRCEADGRPSSSPTTGSGRLRPVERDAALAELARRYLAGHAPAVPEDLARWAGLPLRDARAGIAAAPVDPALGASPPPRLLPAFDPYLLGWKDRSFAVSPEHARRVHPGGGVLRAVATVGGKAVGTWTPAKAVSRSSPSRRSGRRAEEAPRLRPPGRRHGSHQLAIFLSA